MENAPDIKSKSFEKLKKVLKKKIGVI